MCVMTLIFAMDAMQQRNIPMGMSQMTSISVTFSSRIPLLFFFNSKKPFIIKNFKHTHKKLIQ